jgi:leucyl/phenylalanyl-tRNA--protein transferase
MREDSSSDAQRLEREGGIQKRIGLLSPALILRAYRSGIFPMAINQQGDIGWFSPDPRALIPLDDRFHIPHGLKRVLKKNPFRITQDTDFEGVIRGCATAHGNTWISAEIVENYCELSRLGYAHTIEVWRDDELAGGLYGVALGGAFFGESMFHTVTDASKIALVALVEQLRARKFVLLDTQWTTPHLARFGTFQIRKSDYLKLLRAALALDRTF